LPACTSDEDLRQKLRYADRAAFDHYDSQREEVYLHGTHAKVLSDIMAWARHSNSGSCECIYLLNGMVGTG
jgi:hypothetical protein